ncbi:phosphatidylinositide phosphatase SAC1-like protein [Euroglyphus maynei]|uniref:Phosphatidylinositol-3-phosphatase SAC1 n=1 Tax=Euroglyphus maynei TaxID=6958 RepID=A0A1Y3AWY8_EURMA|nr:phosphatidylinositide phosphatase SAC1-like protein [Euroglyphus maynei]
MIYSYETPEYFYLIPVDRSESNVQALSINRVTNEINLFEDSEAIERSVFADICYGIFGIIRLISGNHLILITEASRVGEIYSPDAIVYRMENVRIIAYDNKNSAKPTRVLSDKQKEYNDRYLLMLQSILRMPSYYFSYAYDLSSSLQRTNRQSEKGIGQPLIESANMEFVWNRALLRPLMTQQKFHYFCLPIICGFVAIHQELIKQRLFRWVLLSRRSTNRCGTRWFARGINTDGHVANFIETEQLLLTDRDDRFSFVQIRGSIPLYWSQLPNLRYKPSFVIPNAPHIKSYGQHVRHLAREYGRLCFVNLISNKGSEGRLAKTFTDLVNDGNFNRGNDIPFVNFESFDFHNECRRHGWQALTRLMDQIRSFIDEYGYYWWCSSTNSVQRVQQGIVRTNCIDSLDRTNVVQSMIAKSVLRKQMIDAGILSEFEMIESYPVLNSLFSNMWADHADVCSTQYAGTGALKSDFTRTGKRRLTGVIADGLNSLIRYYKNNFEDGFRQDSIDLILGVHQVDEREGKQLKCPLEERNLAKIFFLPVLFVLSMAMFVGTLLLYGGNVYNIEQAMYTLFWFAMSAICLVIMYYLGNEFADYPTLVRRRR